VSNFISKVDGGYSNIKYNFKDKKIHEIEIILESIKYTKNEIYNSNIPLISIMFQTENYNVPKLYKQYNPLNDETSYLLSFFKINNNEDTIIKTSSNMYYLLIDEEHSNTFSKNICKSLLESLSNDNYFQIIGYQKHFKLYNYLPMKCEKENIENSIKNISFIEKVNNKNNYYNNDIYDNNYDTNKSDFWDESIESDDVKKSNEVDDIKKSIEIGEKDIDKAFEYIFNCNQKEIKDLNKFCFIVGSKNVDKNDISRLMKKYKNIDQKISIFIINIIDMKLELYSLIGINSSYVETNLSENLIKQMKYTQNEIYDEIKFTLGNKNINELILDYNRNEFLSENHLANYFFTLKGKFSGDIFINNAYKKDGDELKDNYSFYESQIINLKEGDILSKIIAHNIIQKKENKETIKKLSEKYQILCEYTNLSIREEEICNSKSIDDNNNLKDNHCFIGKKRDKPLDDDDNSGLLSKIISTQNFKGSWDENQYTKKIIEMKKDIYIKVTKNYKKKRVAITYTILNYMMSNIDNIIQFSEEIENAENYLVKNNCSYDSIQQNINL
jgi:hypothetical protein